MSKTKQFKYKNAIGQDIMVDLAVDAANVETTLFTQAAERENLNPGEGLLTSFGKLMKWFSDLKEIAWSGRYADLTDRPTLGNAASTNIANNLTTADDGFSLDARQGKVLSDSLGGCSFKQEGEEFYIVGSDAVKKKLGSSGFAIFDLGLVSSSITITSSMIGGASITALSPSSFILEVTSWYAAFSISNTTNNGGTNLGTTTIGRNWNSDTGLLSIENLKKTGGDGSKTTISAGLNSVRVYVKVPV